MTNIYLTIGPWTQGKTNSEQTWKLRWDFNLAAFETSPSLSSGYVWILDTWFLDGGKERVFGRGTALQVVIGNSASFEMWRRMDGQGYSGCSGRYTLSLCIRWKNKFTKTPAFYTSQHFTLYFRVNAAKKCSNTYMKHSGLLHLRLLPDGAPTK